MLFKAKTDAKLIKESYKNTYIVNRWSEVDTADGWIFIDKILPGTIIYIDDIKYSVLSVTPDSPDTYKLILTL